MSFGPDEDLRFAEDHIANLEAALTSVAHLCDFDNVPDFRPLLDGGYCRLSCHHAKFDYEGADACDCPCHEEDR